MIDIKRIVHETHIKQIRSVDSSVQGHTTASINVKVSHKRFTEGKSSSGNHEYRMKLKAVASNWNVHTRTEVFGICFDGHIQMKCPGSIHKICCKLANLLTRLLMPNLPCRIGHSNENLNSVRPSCGSEFHSTKFECMILTISLTGSDVRFHRRESAHSSVEGIAS